ncbi:hypothetical protein [Hydrogenophaga pseudoflava]|uniref:hypothetical protein n=1 Tax=Hydrogenophaga pseudoflava TaxID=47421 RepID=UPI0027E4EDAC|nr:hypothetical protein [Hydrogenophaga pseudoflava]MDQ7743206.1 hypothetical protein [Hydrogenophaga pseudoflava]
MNKDLDNPDTFVMDEQSEWESTQMDDVFLPSVQVLIRWSDVEAAVERGAVVPSEAHGLWAAWAAPGSPLRRIGVSVDQAYKTPPVEDTVADDLPDELPPPPPAGGMKQVVMLLIGAVAGAALMFVLGR